MEAGPVMDALVAERVMGWKRPAGGQDARSWMERKKGTENKWESSAWYIDEDPDYYACSNQCTSWRPSTNLEAAMLAVETLRSESAHVVMNTARSDEHLPERIANRLQVEMQSYVDDINDQTGRTWYVAFYRLGGGIPSRNDGHGWAKELPLAICRAALQATLETE